MFGIWRRKKTTVINHQYVLFDNFDTSTAEFYQAIEHDLGARELTGLEISRIEYAEGGVLSAKREYLRLRRERLVFDVCSAPFGTTWFFSYRFAEIPIVIRLWEILALLLALAVIVGFYVSLFGLLLGGILFGASLLSLLLLMRQTVALGMQDVDAALLQIPVLGAFYECFIRAETYYREDTRLAYVKIVEQIVRARIDELGAAGKRLVEYHNATPPSHPAVLTMVADLLRMRR